MGVTIEQPKATIQLMAIGCLRVRLQICGLQVIDRNCLCTSSAPEVNMLRSTFLSLMFVSHLVVPARAQETKTITEAESVIAVFTNDWGLGKSEGPQLIVSIWGDGSVVWSNDHVKGGPPYLASQLNPKNVSDVFKKLTDIGVFDIPRLKQVNFGPDSQFTTILVRSGGKEP